MRFFIVQNCTGDVQKKDRERDKSDQKGTSRISGKLFLDRTSPIIQKIK